MLATATTIRWSSWPSWTLANRATAAHLFVRVGDPRVWWNWLYVTYYRYYIYICIIYIIHISKDIQKYPRYGQTRNQSPAIASHWIHGTRSSGVAGLRESTIQGWADPVFSLFLPSSADATDFTWSHALTIGWFKPRMIQSSTLAIKYISVPLNCHVASEPTKDMTARVTSEPSKCRQNPLLHNSSRLQDVTGQKKCWHPTSDGCQATQKGQFFWGGHLLHSIHIQPISMPMQCCKLSGL